MFLSVEGALTGDSIGDQEGLGVKTLSFFLKGVWYTFILELLENILILMRELFTRRAYGPY